MTSKKYILIAAFIFCFSIIIIRVIKVPLFDAGKARDFIHGDAYSDINTYSAVKYFYDFGFTESCFLPVHGYSGNKEKAGTGVYTHYPALPDILAGAYAKILNTKSDQWIRIFPVMISMVFFFFIFHFFQTILPDKSAAFIGALVVVLSNYFIFWADNLHKHLYEEFLKWLYVFVLYSYYHNQKNNKWLILLCGFIFILATNVSFEPVTYMAVVTVGMSWIYRKKLFSWENIFLGTMPMIGFGIHFYQNVLYFDSLKIAIADMTNAATLRTVGNDSVQNEMKRSIGLLDFLSIPYIWSFRIERYFLIPGPAFFFLAYLGLKELKKADKKLFELGIVLLIATLSWGLAMTQHFLVHGFTTRHLGIFYGFVIGYGLIKYYDLAKENFRTGPLYKKVLHVGFIGYIIAMLFSQQLMDYLNYGFLYLFQ